MVLVTRSGNRPQSERSIPDLRREMDSLLSNFFRHSREDWGGWTPPTDLYETAGAYTVEMELPGFRRDEIEVTVERGVLSVSGGRSVRSGDGGASYHLRERPAGRFSRRFSLPASIDAEGVEAAIDGGILRIRIPKAEEARPRRIEVSVG